MLAGLGGSALGWGAFGCGTRVDAATLADRLTPHEEAVERFGAWALRTTRTLTPRDRARIEEALFAPIRDDARFVVVQVERDGRTPLRMVTPRDARIPAALAWGTVRSPRLGLVAMAEDPSDAQLVWARIEVGAHDPPPIILTLALRALPSPQ
jgi:hypothetical protein